MGEISAGTKVIGGGGNTCIHNIGDDKPFGLCDECAAQAKARAAGLCVNCKVRKPDGIWIGEGSMMDYIHGAGARWCNLCMRREQLKYAERLAADIPRLKAEIVELERRPNG